MSVAGDAELGEGEVRVSGPTLLWVLLGERHWRQFRTFEAQFLRAARELAVREGEPWIADLTVSERTFERWAFGQVRRSPHPDASRVLEHMFGYPVQELLRCSGAGEGPGKAVSAAPAGSEVSSGVGPQASEDVTRALRAVLAGARGDVVDVDDVERRELLRLLGGLGVAAPLVAGADRVRRNLDGALNAPTTGADVAEWERVAAQYSAGSGTVPPAAVLPELLTDLDEAQARLKDSPDALRAPMARVCGQLSALAAMKFFNTGDEGNARRYWRTALRVIGYADDRSAQAVLMSQRASFILLERASSPSAALAFADDAIGVAGGAACAGAVSARGTRAMALALLGDHDASAVTLRDLADSYGRMPGATASADTEWGFSEQQLRFIEGHVHAYAGRVSDAGRALDAGVSVVPAGQVIAVTSFEVNRAVSLMRGGDPSEGARHVVRAVGALPAGFRQSATARRAARALNDVPARAASVPAVAEARELLALPPGGNKTL